ncbi:hypothetical protein [Holzapfeliella floricola]|uniref:hypothetical protein n=1 Tax=Holzapfeliella floricola TaxID=679249 RepID=UPI000A4FF187
MFWTDSHELAAYARILNKDDYISFGRALVTQSFRKQKMGKKLVQTVLDEINQRYSQQIIRMLRNPIYKNSMVLLDFK